MLWVSILILLVTTVIKNPSVAHTLTDRGNKTHPIKLSELDEYIRLMDASDGWKTEFDSLGPPSMRLKPWPYAESKENVIKHRYHTREDYLLTYDETRVSLNKRPNDQFSDFINANWVDSAREAKRYIATQCPMANTILDFYRMIWQYNIHQVVMLASPHDVEKNKCARYFPDGTGNYGDIEVTLQRKTDYADVVVRVYSLKYGSTIRVFVHNHFVSWPDMGVPSDPNQLLNLIRQYRSSDTYTKAWPLVVHCSAGVGRTGTFLLTDAMYDLALSQPSVDFLKHLWLIRNQRISLVEKPEQYALAYRVVLAAYNMGLFDPTKNHEAYFPLPILNTGSMSSMGLLLPCLSTFVISMYSRNA